VYAKYDLLIIGILQVIFLVLMAIVFCLMHLSVFAFIGLFIALILFVNQYLHTRDRLPIHTFWAFLNNCWVGRVIWLGVAISLF
jgi:4-hydroxybenzoate polyprenyltransferase